MIPLLLLTPCSLFFPPFSQISPDLPHIPGSYHFHKEVSQTPNPQDTLWQAIEHGHLLVEKNPWKLALVIFHSCAPKGKPGITWRLTSARLHPPRSGRRSARSGRLSAAVPRCRAAWGPGRGDPPGRPRIWGIPKWLGFSSRNWGDLIVRKWGLTSKRWTLWFIY